MYKQFIAIGLYPFNLIVVGILCCWGAARLYLGAARAGRRGAMGSAYAPGAVFREPRCNVLVSAPIAQAEELALKCSVKDARKSKTNRLIENRISTQEIPY